MLKDEKSGNYEKALECSGFSDQDRQKMFKDMKFIELLTDILYYPF